MICQLKSQYYHQFSNFLDFQQFDLMKYFPSFHQLLGGQQQDRDQLKLEEAPGARPEHPRPHVQAGGPVELLLGLIVVVPVAMKVDSILLLQIRSNH